MLVDEWKELNKRDSDRRCCRFRQKLGKKYLAWKLQRYTKIRFIAKKVAHTFGYDMNETPISNLENKTHKPDLMVWNSRN